MFNTYDDVQLKVGDLTLAQYHLGDKVDIPDGLYFGLEGVVAIGGGQLLMTYTNHQLMDKHGNKIENPVGFDIDKWEEEGVQ
jgi:hypothetical protein